MVETVAIRVTKADITNGTPRSIDRCPIALAVMRRMRKREVLVVAGEVHFGNELYYLDAAGVDFVDAFDEYEVVRPGWVRMSRG